MSGPRLAWAVLLLLPMTLFMGGCIDCEEGPPVTARGITSGSAQGGSGGYDLRLEVWDAHEDRPLDGAGAVVYWGSATVGEWTGTRVEVSDERVVVDPGTEVRTTEPDRTVRLFTGADGGAVAKVPADRIVGLVAAKDGYTEEWVPALASGPRGAADTMRVPLYRSHINLTMDGTWSPGALSTGVITSSQYVWDPMTAPFGHTVEHNRAYAARIVALEVTLEWVNEPMAFGDLGIGIGGDGSGGPRYFHDSSENLAMGAQRETARLSTQDLVDHGILAGGPILVGAATKSGYVGMFGLDYTLHIEAWFDTAAAEFSTCRGGSGEDDNAGVGVGVPGPGLVLVLGTLLAVAVFARRRM